MRTRIRVTRPCCTDHNRGSALILALLLSGILVISIGAMLGTVRNLARSTNDKVTMEEAYSVAMSGLHMAQAYMLDNKRAQTMLGSGPAAQIEKMTSATAKMSEWVKENKSPLLTPSQIVDQFFSNDYWGFTATGTTLSDGRIVIYEFPALADGKVIAFYNDEVEKTPTSMTNSSGSSLRNVRAYIRRLRVTTPYPYNQSGTYPDSEDVWTGEADGLRRTSLIIEAEGYALGAGIPKHRIVQQKILVFPFDELVTSGHAIIAGGVGIIPQGSSSLNVHWAPVIADGPIELLDIDLTNNGLSGGTLTATNKFYGAGAATSPGEFWVRWQGSGVIKKKNGQGNVSNLFPDTIGGVAVTDFFTQLANNEFVAGGWTTATVLLDGYNATHVPLVFNTNLAGSTDPILIGTEHRKGALVQNDPTVTPQVNEVVNETLNYSFWKQYAIDQGIYMRPKSGGGFTDASGQTLYVTPERTVTTVASGNTPLTELKQISMIHLVTSKNTDSISDRVLFIDSLEGTENGTKPTIKISSESKFFWKGLMYLNGNLDIAGAGKSPDIEGKNPDQYYGRISGTTEIQDCFLRGILAITGTMSRTGNAAIYGTLVAKNGYTGSGGPDIYFDPRNDDHGLFADPNDPSRKLRIYDGPIAELDHWPS